VLAQLVENTTGAAPTALNISSVATSIPGWTGDVSAYNAGNGCDCGHGLLDPDCTSAPDSNASSAALVSGCAPLQDISTVSAVAVAAGAAAATATTDDDSVDQVVSDDDEDGGAVAVDLTVITPTRTCAAVPSVANVSTGVLALTLGVCDYSLPGWTGSGADYHAANGVCDCARGTLAQRPSPAADGDCPPPADRHSRSRCAPSQVCGTLTVTASISLIPNSMLPPSTARTTVSATSATWNRARASPAAPAGVRSVCACSPRRRLTTARK
jgi:hypothetical protein